MKESLNDLKENKKFNSDLRKGIPVEARSDAWLTMIGNNLKVCPNLYSSLLVRVRLADRNREEDPQFKKNMSVVEVDIKRTFTTLGHF